jgi:predicted phosphohydrolase
MKIQYCSDLHLEFPINRKYVMANPIKPNGEILLLAGDIMPFTHIEKEHDFLNFLSDNFKHTYWVPGNHEYYHSDITARTGSFHEKIRSNVSLLNNTAIDYKEIRLVFSTLWSRLMETFEFFIIKSMADFRLIKNNGNTITVKDYARLHEECLAFIIDELKPRSEQTRIVVTHHLPTFYNYPEKYRHSELNSAFATELFDLIESSDVAHWILGHTHENVPDFEIGNTTLTCNQLGYLEYGEDRMFRKDLVLGAGD